MVKWRGQIMKILKSMRFFLTSVFFLLLSLSADSQSNAVIDASKIESLSTAEESLLRIAACDLDKLTVYYDFGEVNLFGKEKSNTCVVLVGMEGELSEEGNTVIYQCEGKDFSSVDWLYETGKLRSSPPVISKYCKVKNN